IHFHAHNAPGALQILKIAHGAAIAPARGARHRKSMATLPAPLQRRIEAMAASFLEAPGLPRVDFTEPAGAPALFAPDSVTGRVMKNPLALMIGGIAGVILELAEPRVRTGVWEHTKFRIDPVGRMKRTGHAAMATIYAPDETARAL